MKFIATVLVASILAAGLLVLYHDADLRNDLLDRLKATLRHWLGQLKGFRP